MAETRKALRAGPTMPAFFFGHGNPMNAIQRNTYTEAWAAMGASFRAPAPWWRSPRTGTSRAPG